MDFLRPEDFGLTSPPRAEELVPNSKIRNPTLRERFANISNVYGSINISIACAAAKQIVLRVAVRTIYKSHAQRIISFLQHWDW
jgi:hypothetical protein